MEALNLRIAAAWRAALGTSTPPGLRALAEDWVQRMLPLVLAYRARSAALAQLSYGQQRSLVVGDVDFAIPDADDLPIEALVTSLLVTSFDEYAIDRFERGLEHDAALERSATTVAGAAARHALDGGRTVMRNAIDRDRVTVGWYRVTKDGCCSFCAVLASRGAVYRQDSFDDSDPRFMGGGEEKVHDHCACTLAPLFSREQPVADRNLEYQALWYDSIKASEEDVAKGRARRIGQTFSGKDALNAFRRRYERGSSFALDT